MTDQFDDVARVKNHLRQLQQDMDKLNQKYDDLAEEVSKLSTSINVHEDAISSVNDELSANIESWSQIETQLKTLRVMGLLNRSRFYLAQGNLKIARIGIENARDMLLSMKDDVSDADADTIDAIVEQLNKALNALPRYPVLAADRLEGAWDMLVNSFFPPPSEMEETPEEIITGTETITATVTVVPTTTPSPSP
jgi:chromosome segregation ATPase